jgi:hypothetical protein
MKTLTRFLLSVLFAVPAAVSAECVRGHEKGLNIGWTAFKTPAKAGVKGWLRAKSASGPRSADSWQKLVLAQTLTIESDAKSVDTNDEARDAKIAKFFFGGLKGEIKARVTKIDEKEGVLTLAVTMNGETLEDVAMEYKKEGDSIKARGHIDVLDFGASKALKAINKACYEKHRGKTWSHVEIRFDAKFKPCA